MSSANEAFTISSDSLAYFAIGPTPRGSADKPSANQVAKTTAADTWSALIDGQLAGWAHDPSQLEDDGIMAPSAATITKASMVASSLRDYGASPPTRIVPTGDGGIALQFDRGREFISIEIEPEGLVELFVFDEGRLKHRAVL